MTLEELQEILDEIGIPYSYYHYMASGLPALPYMIYAITDESTEDADNCGYAETATIVIRVYTAEKNFDLEKKIRNVFRQHEVTWTKTEDYIDTENCFVEEYVIQDIFFFDDDND